MTNGPWAELSRMPSSRLDPSEGEISHPKRSMLDVMMLICGNPLLEVGISDSCSLANFIYEVLNSDC